MRVGIVLQSMVLINQNVAEIEKERRRFGGLKRKDRKGGARDPAKPLRE